MAAYCNVIFNMMKFFNFLKITLISIFIIQLNACSLLVPWERVEPKSTNLPWCGPDKHPVEERKSYDSMFAPTGSTIEYRWVTSFWQKHTIYSYPEAIDSYLKKINLIDNWPASQSWNNNINEKVAPYKFTFVSIHPLVVIMRPYEFGPLKNRSTYDIVGSPDSAMRSKYLLNYYEYGTSFPFQPDLSWFSPDLEIKPKKLELSKSGHEEITWDKESIIFQEVNGIVETKRILKER